MNESKPMTLDEMREHLIESFSLNGSPVEEIPDRVDAAIGYLVNHGLLREWGFREDGELLWAADDPYEIARPVRVLRIDFGASHTYNSREFPLHEED